MVRLKDVAEACGVSSATVSRALNGLMKDDHSRTKMIRRTAQEMGYSPNAAAIALKTSHSYNIGVLYEDRMDHEYFSVLLNNLRRAASISGYDLTLICGNEAKDNNYYEHVRRRNLDGVIIIRVEFNSAEVIRLATSNTPSVIIDHMYAGCDCVSSDNRAGIERLVRYATKKGHCRIAIITGENGAVTQERLAGFYKACAELGIQVPDGYVQNGHFHDPASCAEILRQLASRSDVPTCVLCPDDFSCIGAMWYLNKTNPEVLKNMSLIGYDGIQLGEMNQPRLTTYRQNTERIADEAIALLVESIEEPDTHVPKQISVEGTLVDGETVINLVSD